jgi:glycosyltransferase involved in cell wall biosynthesis
MLGPIRHLSELGHDVHVVAFARRDEADAGNALARYCSSVTLVPLPRLWQLRGIVGDPPATLARYYSASMQRELGRIADAQGVDVVELETLHMAVYGRTLASYCRVLRPQNAEHVIWERYASIRRSAGARLLVKMQAARVRAYETTAITTYVDSTLAASEADRVALRAIAPQARVDCLPFGVDTNELSPVGDFPVTPGSIVHTGSYDWAPKRHNLLVLVREIFPLIRRLEPSARLFIVGRGLSGSVSADLRTQDGVKVVGPVPDVRPQIARASVVVNYVESGSGVAVKVLEAMAMGKAVVTNTLGAEGIAAVNGEHIFIASTRQAFAEAVSALLSDAALRDRVGAAARKLVLEKYSSASLAQELVDYFGMLRGTRRPANAS